MPRIRTLKPEHRQHRKIGPLSDRAYRAWVGMLNEADDDGRLVCEAIQLRALLWSYHPRVTVAHVEAAIQEVARSGLICLYEHAGVRYAAFPSWRDHQPIHRRHYTPSRLPACPDKSVESRESGTGTGLVPPRREGEGRELKTRTPPPSPSSGGDRWGTPEAFVKLWNEATPDECPAVEELSDGRRQKIRAALKQFPAREYWEAVTAEFHRSKFLRNLTPKRPGHESFQANLDWLLQRGKDQVENYVKVHEGKYRD